jgi:hypothetical protein
VLEVGALDVVIQPDDLTGEFRRQDLAMVVGPTAVHVAVKRVQDTAALADFTRGERRAGGGEHQVAALPNEP